MCNKSVLGKRVLGRAAAAGIVLSWLALPAAADGLSRFKEAIKDSPPGALTYKNAKALGDNGFVLEDVVITQPADKAAETKAEPIAIKRVTVEDLDFAAVEKKAAPTFLKLRAEGIAVTAKPAEGVDLKELAGIDKITADFQVDYRLDPARKTLTLNRLEIDMPGLARTELSFVLDGVSPDHVGKPEDAMKDATLRTATLSFEDRSLLSKVLPAAAKSQGSDADALVKVGRTFLEGMRSGQAAETVAAIDAVVSYMDDYKQPKGALKVTLNPTGKTTAESLKNVKSPDEAVKALGIVVSYAGTRPGPAPGPATTQASTGAGGCSPGARFYVLHEDAYWSVTVREPKGEQCVARLDGGAEDLTFAVKDTVAWTIDGPGKPGKCDSGAKVVVENDGAWYPAKVTTAAHRDGECPIKFDGPDGDEDTVATKKVRHID